MNPGLLIPPRPTISNLQWVSGTQYITPADMDLLSKLPSLIIPSLSCVLPDLPHPFRVLDFIHLSFASTDNHYSRPKSQLTTQPQVGGPNRPPSKRALAQTRQDEAAHRLQARSATASSSTSAPTNPEEEGYWAYMQRTMNERTEKLGLMGDSMERLGEQSSGWAEDVNKFVGRQKRNLVLGAVKGRFGL